MTSPTEPGRELDAYLAEKMLGWSEVRPGVRFPAHTATTPGGDRTEVPALSTTDAGMGMIFKHLTSEGFPVMLWLNPHEDHCCEIEGGSNPEAKHSTWCGAVALAAAKLLEES